MRLFALFFIFASLFNPIFGQVDELIPVPKNVIAGDGKFDLKADFSAKIVGKEIDRLKPALLRMLKRLDGRTGLNFTKDISPDSPEASPFVIQCGKKARLNVRTDESYFLRVSPTGIVIQSATDIGCIRALETLLQLLDSDQYGYFFPAVEIRDEARFPWRGLLIDVCRHFMPMEVIKRNIDGMAALKMNVLHLHLSEDQGFRIESKKFPELHEKGSNGEFFTQNQIKEIIQYADQRGIRVIPEFDMPGHVTSWLASHPELGSAPGPYDIEKKFGVMDPAFNPANPKTYEFLDVFLTEMSGLFPDLYFHIGGDENNGKHWDKNPDIQAFKKKNHLKDNHDLQAYFVAKVHEILKKNNKIMVGWDEILVDGMSKDIMIQSWRGKESLIKSAQNDYYGILSNGYYIDLCKPAREHYVNDPIPLGTPLSEAQQKFILGGEATMWAELISPETIDSRIWPRTAAIAERFWSPQNITDVDDMYRRLKKVQIDLEELGLCHLKNQAMMARRLCGTYDPEPLMKLLDFIQPLKIYTRHSQGLQYSTDLPLTRLPDMAFPEAPGAQNLKYLIDNYFQFISMRSLLSMERIFTDWKKNAPDYFRLSTKAPILKEGIPLTHALRDLGELGIQKIKYLRGDAPLSPTFSADCKKALKKAEIPISESEVAVTEAMRTFLLYKDE